MAVYFYRIRDSFWDASYTAYRTLPLDEFKVFLRDLTLTPDSVVKVRFTPDIARVMISPLLGLLDGMEVLALASE